MSMTDSELGKALATAGWPSDVTQQALCIIARESNGDNWCVGDRELAPDHGPSYGLFQIDIGYHPDFDLMRWWEPVYNCEYALGLWKANGNSFDNVWSTAGDCQ